MQRVQYTPVAPRGKRVPSDRYFSLMADEEGVGFVHCGDGVVVVPLTADGQVLLVLERSPALHREVLTLVGGSVEDGEGLEEAANRELQEEVGFRAESFELLGELHPFKYLTTRQFAFLARDLTPSKLTGDESHAITGRRVELDDFTELCRSGKLRDASAIVGPCLARDFLARSQRHDT